MQIIYILIGAFAAILGQILVQRWRYGREAIDRRCDEIERAAGELVEISTEYWSKSSPSGPVTKSGEFTLNPLVDVSESKRMEIIICEARIIGLVSKVNGLNSVVIDDFDDAAQQKILGKLADFNNQVTGGNFQVKYRAADPERIVGVHGAHADYICEMRRSITRRWGVQTNKV